MSRKALLVAAAVTAAATGALAQQGQIGIFPSQQPVAPAPQAQPVPDVQPATPQGAPAGQVVPDASQPGAPGGAGTPQAGGQSPQGGPPSGRRFGPQGPGGPGGPGGGFAGPQQGGGQSLTVDAQGVQLRLPVAGGHCSVDETNAADQSVITSARDNAGDGNVFLGVTIGCQGLTRLRANQATPLFVNTYLSRVDAPSPELARAPLQDIGKQVCTIIMGSLQETPTRSTDPLQKAQELQAAARQAGADRVAAILSNQGAACYVGTVTATPGEGGRTSFTSTVVATTVIQGRYVTLSLDAVNQEALTAMFPRARQLMAAVINANGRGAGAGGPPVRR